MKKRARELDMRSLAERQRSRRALYRKRRLMAVAVLVGLSLGIGAFAGVFFPGGGPEAGYVPAKAGEVRSPRAAAEGAQESRAPSEMKARVLAAYETAKGLAASRTSGPTHDNPANKPAPGKPLDVLVLGVDRRPESAEGSSSHSDTIMLFRVSPKRGQVRSLSVPRDLLVEVEPGVEDRINMAYLHGGVKQSTAVVENLTGISVERYAIVDFGGFEDAIDALGGVTVEVEQPIRVGIEGHRVYIPAGTRELDGLEALAYARYRGTACGDLDRIRRQQRLVAALREQALGWNTITKLPRIVRVMHQNVDTNLGIVQAITLGRALVGRGESGGMRFAQLKGKPEILPNGNHVLVPDEQANERILENFRNDSPVKPRQDQAPRVEDSPSKC
jgi:polyisoprenyl-teichoic acid--peptidoglycan teichoic acid transferase